MERIFELSSFLVLPVWLMMVFLPRWRWTERIVASPFVAILPAVLYIVLIAPILPTVLPAVAQPTLAGIASLLGSPLGATIGWAHFLAFDLFVGRWIYLDAREHGIPAPLVSAILLTTLMFGPIGYVAHLATRSAAKLDLMAHVRKATKWLAYRSSLLWYGAIGFFVLYVGFLALMAFDSRSILGLNPWIKPSKFAISIVIYLATMAWLVGYLEIGARVRAFISWSLVLAMVVEIVLIGMQAARGTTSHFNIVTPLDSAIFATMGIVISFAAVVAAYVLYLYVHAAPDLPAPLLWGIRLGLAVFLLANVQGWVMAAHLSHSVGAADGGPGLPYVNWSTTVGDLRVAHFIGLHAIQALPLAGLLFTALERRGLMRGATLWTAAAAVAYTLVVVGTAVQAFSGRPLIRF